MFLRRGETGVGGSALRAQASEAHGSPGPEH